MKSTAFPFVLGLAALAGGCATTPRPAPVEVSRYHLDLPAGAGTIAMAPHGPEAGMGPEFQVYADAVGRVLGQYGYTVVPDRADAAYVAEIGWSRTLLGEYRTQPPLTIGLGGGSGGYRGGGVGGSVAFGVGSKRKSVLGMALSVQIRRSSDNVVVWEGNARTQGVEDAAAMQPVESAPRLAAALFKDFPGESGITITVK